MKSLQLPILALVLIVAACAIAFTALKTASELWYSTFYTFTAVLLLSAVIAARFRRGNEKAFWFGFAVFGWAFFVVGLGPWPDVDTDPDGINITLNRQLLTSRVIEFLVPYLRSQANDFGRIGQITTNAMGIAHLLTTLAIATAGGALAFLIRRRRGRRVTVKSLTRKAKGCGESTAIVDPGSRPHHRGLRDGLHRAEDCVGILVQRIVHIHRRAVAFLRDRGTGPAREREGVLVRVRPLRMGTLRCGARALAELRHRS